MKTFHEKCLICDSGQLHKLKGYEQHHLVKCQNCRFVFARKAPTSLELEAHYNNYKRDEQISPITLRRYNELLDTFEKHRHTNKLIDVGCGQGFFLLEAKKRGWEVYGTEFTDAVVEECIQKGISTKKGELNINNYPETSFDIITSFEVLEHINNPLKEINRFKIILRKQGIVYITTPNFNSLLRYYLKDKYNVIEYPEHLSYYTPRTLNKLFVTNGFAKHSIRTTGISPARFKTSLMKSGELNSETSSDESLRNRTEASRMLQLAKKVTNSTLTLIGTGDTIKAVFSKK